MTRKKKIISNPELSLAEARAIRIGEIKEQLDARARSGEIRRQSAARIENCHLMLALALRITKEELDVSWRDFSDLLETPIDFSYLFKIATRKVFLKKTTFDILRARVLRIANTQLGLRLIVPEWDEAIDNNKGN